MIPPVKPDVCEYGKVVTYQFDNNFKVTEEMKAVYNYDGVIMVKGLLSKEELAKVEHVLNVTDIRDRAFEVADGSKEGRASRLSLWSHPGNDVTGMIARSQKVAGTCQELLGGDEVYHYHTKLMMKEPRTGGAHLWHQDYGYTFHTLYETTTRMYWYKNGCLKPDLNTAFIAIDKCVKENRCLQVVLGSHRCGRIEHSLQFGQTVAEQQQVDWICKEFAHVHVEMDPGDAIFFHCNLLHTSAPNNSDMRRYAFLCSYNRKDNNPMFPHHHPQYTPMTIVPNSAIMECTNYTDLDGKGFTDPSQDATIRAILVKTGYH